MKRLTTNIARMLAQKVCEKLREKAKEYEKTLRPKVLASKEMKEFVKLENELRNVTTKIDEKRKQITDKFNKDGYHVRVFFSGGKGEVQINTSMYSTFEIADMLMLEDHFSDGSTTAEEIVDKIADKLLKIK